MYKLRRYSYIFSINLLSNNFFANKKSLGKRCLMVDGYK